MIQGVILWLLLAVNGLTFCLYGWDKFRAKQGKWRVPERVLLAWAAAFGSVGALLGMAVFHHKTRKPKFHFGVPALLAAQLILVYAAVRLAGPALLG